MSIRRLFQFFTVLIVIVSLSACNLRQAVFPPVGQVAQSQSTPTPPPPEALVRFRVLAPGITDPQEKVYLSVLDEVTGLALNAQFHEMQIMESPDTPDGASTAREYDVTLPFAVGSVVKYRYEREAGSIRVGEHLPDGNAVRYRLFVVQGPGEVQDVVSRWTDTTYEGPSGRILGQAIDSATALPISNLLVTAGGAQTLTASDGSFRLEGLPEGVHNLVGYSLDGTWRTFQQGARVAAESTTPAEIRVEAAPLVKVVFVLRTPPDTPPIVPLRLAGNLLQLGNTFADLNGGISAIADNMPVMKTLPDGRYTLSLNLPAGTDLRYKYTLGDGFWNAEHNLDGTFRLRQLIVPDKTTLVEDEVDTWHAGGPPSITFDVYAPAETPAEDIVSIQFGPLFGWTEPIPMWPLGGNRWAYVLFSPLSLPGNFTYRYCRNSQCGAADDIQTPGQYGPGRLLKLSDQPLSVEDSVSGWVGLLPEEGTTIIPTATVSSRGAAFITGVGFSATYHPSWKAYLAHALDDVQQMNANHLVLAPTWSFQDDSPDGTLPVLAPETGRDALWPEIVRLIEQGRERGLEILLHPTPNFPAPAEQWWLEARRDITWWQVWFEQYRQFVIHHADLASLYGADVLVLGGDWIAPALPGGLLSDGLPSGGPDDAEARWRDLIAGVRSHYKGRLAWNLTVDTLTTPPAFLDAVDEIYLTVPYTVEMGDFGEWLDTNVLPLEVIQGKRVILAVIAASDPDLQTQVDAYQEILSAASNREWIHGLVSLEYYPPAVLRDNSASVHGKPAAELLRIWFSGLAGGGS